MTKQNVLTILSLLWMVLLSVEPGFSQQNQTLIRGTVKSIEGNPIEGVSVMLTGTRNGTSTNADGIFELEAPANNRGTLTLTHTGYITQTVNISGQELQITMQANAEDLDEVVVVGYGTQKRKDLTGAVASVQAEKLEKEAPRSVQDLLRGNAAGIVIGQGNTAKGDADLLVRGRGTLKAGASPLNVVDGVIFDGTFADLNPNDIASIDILKDASATAVYGARAANGVVLITTKRGASGKPTITLNGNYGFVENSYMPKVMNGQEFLAYRYDYEMGKRAQDYHDKYPEMFVDPRKLSNVDQLTWFNYDQKDAASSVTEEQLIRSWLARLELRSPEIENYLIGKETNWQDLVFHKGIQQDYTASISNKTDNLNYYFSLNHVDREGFIVGNRFKNFRTRINLESKITNFLKVGTNANFAARNEGFLQADWGQSAIIPPYGSDNIGDPNSLYRRLPTGDVTPVNPFFDNMFRNRVDRYNTLNATLYGIITLPYGFEIQSNFTPSFIWREYYNHDSSLNPEWAAKGGTAERSFHRTYNWQMDNVIRWKKAFGEHNFEVTLLQNAEKGQYWRTKATASNFVPSDILEWHRIQAGTVPLNESDDTYRTGDALMGRLFYSFKDTYLLTASVRRDGYSAFGAQNPRATFPALAFGWNFTNEKFMEGTKSWLDYGKLRLSWGRNGNRDIPQYDALSDMTSGLHPYIDSKGNIYLGSQLYVNRMANLGLKWENKSSYNFGLDFAILKNRISGAIDVYSATTHDLLVDRELPEIIGFSSVAANLGELKSHGVDVSITGNIIQNESFNWSSNFIFMKNRRKIVTLYGDMIDVLDDAGNVIGQREADDIKNRWFIGEDPDRIWDYERNGIWQESELEEAEKYGLQPGDFKYIDQNADGVMTDSDRIFQRYKTPRFRWSWRNDFNYKNFNLSVFVYSNWGQTDGFNRAANNSNFADRTTDYVMPRWTPENPIDDYARIGSKNIGTNYINKSFIRLENISLSYLVPSNILDKASIRNLRISASVRNAAMWAPHWDFGDPEGFPVPRTYNLSLNFSL
ncbi:SusC/RagA family TonB-linked outer membrane protein [Sphingobacterium endophyticum]|uniref:SusC/RagA family TonB-linked outer membrane protein n=1 Tax=Sphingobacterium endophyticum TaxID=2546448 RepID=UPI0012E30086|nr:SusC/RagA family TonB-linked outer membrane protein [Sphingobacterium endophyticum]